MNAIAKPELLSIEVACLESQVAALADDLVALSDPSDTVSVIKSNWIHITYLGRGSESITLCLNGKYSDSARIQYARENMQRLEKIKSDLVSWAA